MTRQCAVVGAIFLLLASPARSDPLKRVVVFGDSLTANATLRTPGHLWTEIASRKTCAAFQVIASPGAHMTPYKLAGMSQAAVAVRLVLDSLYAVSEVVAMLGTVDWGMGVPIDSFEAAYTDFVQAWRPETPLVCITPAWRENETVPNANGDTLADFRAVIERVCAGKIVVDGTSLIPGGPRFFPDGVHPNEAGTRRLAKALLPYIRAGLGE